MSGGRQKKMLLANAVEAIIAALHIDGGLEWRASSSSTTCWAASELEEVSDDQETNYKSTLQERAQAIHLPQPQYVIVEETGPGHAKTFVVEARVGTAYRAPGLGTVEESGRAKRRKSHPRRDGYAPAAESQRA